MEKPQPSGHEVSISARNTDTLLPKALRYGFVPSAHLALNDAGIEAAEIAMVSGHGTATRQGDIAETLATQAILGADKPMHSLKSYFGHTLGACGALEAWLAIEMMRESRFVPTANLQDPDPACGVLDYIMGEARSIDAEFVMSNNFAFGGINTSLILARH